MKKGLVGVLLAAGAAAAGLWLYKKKQETDETACFECVPDPEENYEADQAAEHAESPAPVTKEESVPEQQPVPADTPADVEDVDEAEDDTDTADTAEAEESASENAGDPQ